MASGIGLGPFGSRPDGMQQRSCSVSSADQWSEATVIANSAISSGKRGCGPTDPRPPCRPCHKSRLDAPPQALCTLCEVWHLQGGSGSGACLAFPLARLSLLGCLPITSRWCLLVQGGVDVHPHWTDVQTEAAGGASGFSRVTGQGGDREIMSEFMPLVTLLHGLACTSTFNAHFIS